MTIRSASIRPACLALSLALAAAGVAFSTASAQPASSEQKVFLDYTQSELDKAYNQQAWITDKIPEIVQTWIARSKDAREHHTRDTYRYGPSEAETLDLFSADRADAPTLFFIHGGAWRAGHKDAYSFLADAFVPYGANLVVLNFDNIPEARLPEMAEQVRRAIAWTHGNAPVLGIDADQFYVTGHSSGGHLTGVALTTDWDDYGLPSDVIKGGIPVSGMFDLEPVMLSARSEYVGLNEAEEAALSPMRHLHEIRAPLIVTYGGQETPEFQRQSRDFYQALDQIPYQAELIYIPKFNHFEMLDSLADPEGKLARATRRMMNLSDDSQ